MCSICHENIETHDHFLTCNEGDYPKYQQSLLDEMIIYCTDWQCPKPFIQIIKNAFTNLHQTKIKITDYDVTYKHLIKQQTQIGWIQLLYGQFSTEWVRLHETITMGTKPHHKQ